jgi:tetratricopeptide (TPR) repeat protein
MRRETRICLLLGFITLAVFWPVTHFDFINYDDPFYVINNPAIQHGVSTRAIVWAWRSVYMTAWHPLTWISHMVDWDIFGPKPGGHHLTSLLFHAANVMLLFFVLRQLTGATWRSAVVAALFAWHPLHVESVAWVSERKDVLSTFFWLLTMAAYAKYANSTKLTMPGSKSKILYYGLALISFAFGLMSKSMVVTLPFVLLLLDYWPLNRVRISPKLAPDGQISLMQAVAEKIPFLVLAALACLATIWAQMANSDLLASSVLPLSDRVANALVSYAIYLRKMLWPNDLSVFYPYSEGLRIWQLAGSVLLLSGITLMALWLARKWRFLAVGWFWFLGTLVPVIGFVPVSAHSMADRYTYIPLIGVFIMVVWGTPELVKLLPHHETWLKITAGLVLAGCLIGARVQVDYWRNSVTLLSHAVEITHNNIKAEYNLALALSQQGDAKTAIEHYQRAIEIRPNRLEAHYNSQWKAHYNLAQLLIQRGQWEEAETHYRTAAHDRPAVAEIDLADIHNNLGGVLRELGRLDEAAAEYRLALQMHPTNALSLRNLAGILAEQQKFGEAIINYEKAVRLEPGNGPAHNNYGLALEAAGKMDEAQSQFQMALKVLPNYAEARVNMGNLLLSEGGTREAKMQFDQALLLDPALPQEFAASGTNFMAHGRLRLAFRNFKSALQLNPDEIEALSDLAWLYATQRDPALRNGVEAVRLAEHGCELTSHQDVKLLGALDAAYAEAGFFDQAIATARMTEEVARNQGDTRVAEAAQKRMELYRSGKPFREP